jgi:cell envelope opacity-associated protein A
LKRRIELKEKEQNNYQQKQRWPMQTEIIITIKVKQLSSPNPTLSTMHAPEFIHKHIYKYEMKSQNKFRKKEHNF